MNPGSVIWLLWLATTLFIGWMAMCVLQLPIFVTLPLAALCGMVAPVGEQVGSREGGSQ